MKTNRRDFIKTALATGLGAGLLGVGATTAEALGSCPSNLVQIDGEWHHIEMSWGPDDCEGYRLTFNQAQSYDWNGWHGEWIHQHNDIDILWVSCCDDWHSSTLSWHRKPGPFSPRFREAIDVIRDQLNRIHWTRHLVQVSFTIPRWAIEAMCNLPEGEGYRDAV